MRGALLFDAPSEYTGEGVADVQVRASQNA